MGSRLKKSVISENVRKSLSKWHRRVKAKRSSSYALLTKTSPTSLDFLLYGIDNSNSNKSAFISETEEGSSSGTKDNSLSNLDDVSMTQKL